MNKSPSFQRDCTEHCKSIIHGDLISTALTVLDVSDHQLCSYINYICTNCDLVKDSVGKTALHTAASYGNLEVVRWLLNIKNSNINARDHESGYTPLHRALYFGRIHIAVELIKSGANSTLRDMNGLTALDHVIEDGIKPDVKYGTLYTWGLNKNNSLGSFSSRMAPECLDIFHKKNPKLKVKQICIDKFHSVIVTTTGEAFSCGHGLGGRLGLGTELTVVNPTKIDFQSSEKVFINEVAIARDHCLFLTNDNLLYSCGLNKYKVLGITPAPEKSLFPEKLKYFQNKSICGISTSRYHSAAWSSKTLYTWGLNGGQLGHEPLNGNYQVVVPKAVQVINVEYTDIKNVVSSDGAIAVLTGRGDIYVLHEYQCRKIASRLLNISDVAIIGGRLNTASDKDLKTELVNELKIIVLTTSGNLLLWQESDQQLCRCLFSIPRILIVKQVSININGVLFVTDFGECYTATIKPRKKRTLTDRKNTLNEFSTNEENVMLKLSKIPRIYRAVSIVSDPRGEDFCVIQQDPYENHMHKEHNIETEMEYDLTRLLEEAMEEDNIHDVLLKIGTQVFPAHKYILARKSNLLNNLCDKTNEIIVKDVNSDFFQQLLYFIYTDHCTLLEVGECPTQFIKYCFGPDKKEEGSNTQKKSFQNPIRHLQELSKRFGCKDLHKILYNYDMTGNYIFKKYEIYVARKKYGLNDFSEYHDVLVKCSNGVEIKAHKCILVGRLEYFSNLFSTRWNNETKSSILISYPSHLVEAFLEFLYTGSKEFLLKKDGDFLVKLLILADEYLVKQLKDSCAEIILNLNYLTLKNAIEILQLAHDVKSSILKMGVMKYIVNNMTYYFETGGLEDLSDELLTDVSLHYISYRQVDYRYLAYDSSEILCKEIIDVHAKYPVSLEFTEKKKVEKAGSKISKRRSKSLRNSINEKNIKNGSDEEENPDTIIQFPDTIESNERIVLEDNGKTGTKKRLSAISSAMDILKSEDYVPEYTSLNSYSPSVSLNDFPSLSSPQEGSYHKLGSSPGLGKTIKKHRMVRLSQKERMRLSSESKETTATIPESPKNPWKILPDITNLTANSPPDSAFSNILSDERKLKENFVKITNKQLVHTQMEDRAIMDLEKFYNVDAIEDEVITVQRVAIGNIAAPIWVPSNRAHSSHS